MKELLKLKKINRTQLLNEIFVLFYKWIELDVKISDKDLKELFILLFSNDRRYVRLVPLEIEEDIFVLEDILSKYSLEEKKEIFHFVKYCMYVYSFDKLKKKEKKLEVDVLYYRAAISQYSINNILNNTYNKEIFEKLKTEFFQLGTLMNNFYKSKIDDEKKSILLIIKSKIKDIFKRYNFEYSYPVCLA